MIKIFIEDENKFVVQINGKKEDVLNQLKKE